jgi:hypothetical protein
MTSATLPGAFTVEQGGAPSIAVSLIGRNVMRASQPQLYFINVLDNGTVDGGPVRVWIAFPNYLTWQSPQQAASSSGQLAGTAYVAFDVANSFAGSSVQIPILLTAPDNPMYAHQVFQVQAWKEGK